MLRNIALAALIAVLVRGRQYPCRGAMVAGPERAPEGLSRKLSRRCGPSLTWALAIFGEAELWSVEYNVIHDTGVERGAIDSGGKAWIVANMLLIGMSAGGDVG